MYLVRNEEESGRRMFQLPEKDEDMRRARCKRVGLLRGLMDTMVTCRAPSNQENGGLKAVFPVGNRRVDAIYNGQSDSC